MPLVNHAFSRVTPAIFVVFVLSRALSSKALVYWSERNVIFALFVKNPLVLAGQRHGLPKAPFWGPSDSKGFLKGVFVKMYDSHGRDAVSAKCTAGLNTPQYLLFPWAWPWTLQKTPFGKTTFAETPFSWFLGLFTWPCLQLLLVKKFLFVFVTVVISDEKPARNL